MTTRLKEMNGSRSVEMEMVGQSIFVETGRGCYEFDRKIFIHALEQELGVVVLENVNPFPSSDDPWMTSQSV